MLHVNGDAEAAAATSHSQEKIGEGDHVRVCGLHMAIQSDYLWFIGGLFAIAVVAALRFALNARHNLTAAACAKHTQRSPGVSVAEERR